MRTEPQVQERKRGMGDLAAPDRECLAWPTRVGARQALPTPAYTKAGSAGMLLGERKIPCSGA